MAAELLNNVFTRDKQMWRRVDLAAQQFFGPAVFRQVSRTRLMIEVRFDAEAEERLVLVVEPPPPRIVATDSSAAAESLFAILAGQADQSALRSQLR